jgi:hypothetical protein
MQLYCVSNLFYYLYSFFIQIFSLDFLKLRIVLKNGEREKYQKNMTRDEFAKLCPKSFAELEDILTSPNKKTQGEGEPQAETSSARRRRKGSLGQLGVWMTLAGTLANKKLIYKAQRGAILPHVQ